MFRENSVKIDPMAKKQNFQLPSTAIVMEQKSKAKKKLVKAVKKIHNCMKFSKIKSNKKKPAPSRALRVGGGNKTDSNISHMSPQFGGMSGKVPNNIPPFDHTQVMTR